MSLFESYYTWYMIEISFFIDGHDLSHYLISSGFKQVWPVFQVIFADEITADDEKFSPIIDDFRDEMIEGILSK